MKKMRIYFDTEFTGLHKDTTLISIGMVAENGKMFYAELDDYDRSQCDDWINEYVISELLHDKPEIWESGIADVIVYGNKFEVGCKLRDWLQQFDAVQFVSDVCHYDMVLLIDLLGKTAFDLPNNVSAVCYDINQDIADYYQISCREAFDKSREEIVKSIYGENSLPNMNKHNALYDAIVIQMISKALKYRWTTPEDYRNNTK